MKAFLERTFHLSERGTRVSTELIGGLIVFLAMVYILPLNSNILSSMGMNTQGVFIATAIAGAIATLIMGLVANFPVALSAGMGMNAFVAFTIYDQLNYSWQETMILLLISGTFFFVFSLTPVRRWIINAIPKDLKLMLSAGLGAFIAFVGLKGAGIITASSATLVTLGTLSDPAVLLAFFGIVLVFICFSVRHKRINQMAVVIAMTATALIGLVLWLCGVKVFPDTFDFSEVRFADWSGLKEVLLFGTLSGDTNNEGFIEPLMRVLSRPETYIAIFSLTFVNLFDTTATLVAVGKGAGIMDADGNLRGGYKAVLADASGALISGPLGTSPVTSFAESAVGVESGARTGLMAVTVAGLFLVSTLIYPIFYVFTNASITAMALVSVGALMFANNVKDITWKDPIIGFTAFMVILGMMLTYSISNGLGLGLILFVAMMLVSKRGKEISPVLYITTAFFLANFIVSEIIKHLT